MKVLFLIEGEISPAPRYRVLQYLPYLQDQGVATEVRAMHGARYPSFYHHPLFGKIYKLGKRSLRWFAVADAADFDVVFLQRPTLPHSAFVERRLFAKNPRVIFDFDDAVFQTEVGESAARKAVFDEIVAGSREVIAGTGYLAGFVKDRPVTVIPTVVDTDIYGPRTQSRGEKMVIGWMGTHGNYVNFEPLLPMLAEFLTRRDVVLRLVSDLPPSFSLPNMEFIKWSAAEEVALLQSFDIGLMPLRDTSWNRGKCAFKLIQYMSVASPVVAGSVGANRDVVVHGESGFLADTAEEWRTALTTLVEDAAKAKSMGLAGRNRCEQYYSVKGQAPRVHEVITRVANARSKAR